MIFYFSATGNSKWIAEQTAKALGDQAVDMLKTNPRSYTFSESNVIGVVFPIYYYSAPNIVLDFAKQLDANGAYTFAICNYCNVSGHALQQFSADALHLNSGYGLMMPDNAAVIGSAGESEVSRLEKLESAPQRLRAIIERILAREVDVFDSDEGDEPEENTRIWPARFREEYSSTTPPLWFQKKSASPAGCVKASVPEK